MFLLCSNVEIMQDAFDFGGDDIQRCRASLRDFYGPLGDPPRRSPLGQLLKSMISSRTRDAVSRAAYRRMTRRWPAAAELAKAAPRDVEQVIYGVTFAEKKAEYVPAALSAIGRERPDFNLGFLGDMAVPDALAWLERLPGVGRKVAAATLNASTLRRPVFIVDSHVHRALLRSGFVGAKADPRMASEAVTAAARTWEPDALLELFVHMKRLGQTLCRFENPACDLCPLAGACATARRLAA